MTASKTQPFRPYLAITMGDPAGIGPEIIVKALTKAKVWQVCRPIVVGSFSVMGKAVHALKLPVQVIPVEGHNDHNTARIYRPGNVPVLDPFDKPIRRFRLGCPSVVSGAAAVHSIQTAVRLAQNRCVNGVVTAPINKKAIHLAGYNYPGHTELLAKLTRAKEAGMMILGGPLKILFVTTHIAIHDLSRAITTARVTRAIRLAHQGLHQLFRIARPRIGVAALNPHAGEDGLFGQEERRRIAPAVERAQSLGIRCSGPHPADTLFGKAIRGEYDGIVAMYHDQGLIALKTLAFGQSINLTVGLPIIRTSVDHGTAYDIVGQGKADPSSLIEAITLAASLALIPKR